MSDATSTARYTFAIPRPQYTDAHAAIAWLVKTFDADARHVNDELDNTVAHAEVWFGSACVIVLVQRECDTCRLESLITRGPNRVGQSGEPIGGRDVADRTVQTLGVVLRDKRDDMSALQRRGVVFSDKVQNRLSRFVRPALKEVAQAEVLRCCGLPVSVSSL